MVVEVKKTRGKPIPVEIGPIVVEDMQIPDLTIPVDSKTNLSPTVADLSSPGSRVPTLVGANHLDSRGATTMVTD